VGSRNFGALFRSGWIQVRRHRLPPCVVRKVSECQRECQRRAAACLAFLRRSPEMALRHRLRFRAAAYVLAFALNAFGTATGSPFTVIDSISWGRIARVSQDDESPNPLQTALFSPDGAHFVLKLSRGELNLKGVRQTLLLYSTADVRAYAEASRDVPSPRPTLLAEILATIDGGEIHELRWLDAKRVSFIASDGLGLDQAYTAEIGNRSQTQVTHSALGIGGFAISGTRVLYYAHPKLEQKQVLPLAGRGWPELLLGSTNPEWINAGPVELIEEGPDIGPVEITQPGVLLPQDRRIWPSPSGRFAVIRSPAVGTPSHWAKYAVAAPILKFSKGRESSDATSRDMFGKVRYELVDTVGHSVRALLDAPCGSISGNGTPIDVFWEDDASVILTNAYLPIDRLPEEEQRLRARTPATVEIHIPSNRVTPILWEPPAFTAEDRASSHLPERSIVAIGWKQGSGTLEVALKSRSEAEPVVLAYQRTPNGWAETERRPAVNGAVQPLLVSLRQGLNDRPKVYVSMQGGASARVLFDPNPQADGLTFGRAEIYEWNDANGVRWKGTLIKPTAFVSGKRYPLIVQTHGWNSQEFLVDGPYGGTTAFAAQAFANAGFVVLQIQDHGALVTDDEKEGPAVAEGYRAAIEQLISSGLAEPKAVGVIGFSRTGYYVLHLLALYPNLVAAATIADSIQKGYLEAILDGKFSASLQRLNGGPPDIDRVGDWFNRNPLYRLSHSSAAIRIEAIGPTSLIYMWETYAVLVNTGRPVDLVYFPRGSHVLEMPQERLGSQGGSVDWFRFWLEGFEDPNPSKAAQYSAWRRLKCERSNASSGNNQGFSCP
jgi:hypothetical protein